MKKPINLALLIDDNAIDQRGYTRILRKSGLVQEVKSFLYAEDALSFLECNRDVQVDVIFLDINMPRMDGFEFLQAATESMGEEFVRIVVAMLTTSLDPKDRIRAESFDVVKDFIHKPLTVEHVANVTKHFADRLKPDD